MGRIVFAFEVPVRSGRKSDFMASIGVRIPRGAQDKEPPSGSDFGIDRKNRDGQKRSDLFGARTTSAAARATELSAVRRAGGLFHGA